LLGWIGGAMTDYYYDVTVTPEIPHGADILNKPAYFKPDGAGTFSYISTVHAWPTASVVRVVTNEGDLEKKSYNKPKFAINWNVGQSVKSYTFDLKSIVRV
jgi:hypothetical protein